MPILLANYPKSRLLLAAVTALSICSAAYALDPELKVNVDQPAHPTISGETNLPDQSELLISIRRDSNGYYAQDTVKVLAGKFHSQQFSNHHSDLMPGQYTVMVSLSLPYDVAPAFRPVFGLHGEKLKGRLVKHQLSNVYVEYQKRFTVEGVVDPKAERAAKSVKAAQVPSFR